MSNKVDLSEVSSEDLLAELRMRPEYVLSAWSKDDLTSTIEAHIADSEYDPESKLPALTDEQVKEAAFETLDRCRGRLEDVLAERGNDFLADRWHDNAHAICEEVLNRADTSPKP